MLKFSTIVFSAMNDLLETLQRLDSFGNAFMITKSLNIDVNPCSMLIASLPLSMSFLHIFKRLVGSLFARE